MENSVFSRVAAYLCLAGLAIMIIDSYCVPPATVEIFDHEDVVPHSGSRQTIGATYDDYRLVSTTGDKMWAPTDTDMNLQAGDTFFIQRSGIFRKIVGGSFPLQGGKTRTYNSGVLRRHAFGWIMVVLVFGLSIVHVGRRKMIRDTFTDDKLIVFLVAAMGVLVAFYIFQ